VAPFVLKSPLPRIRTGDATGRLPLLVVRDSVESVTRIWCAVVMLRKSIETSQPSDPLRMSWFVSTIPSLKSIFSVQSTYTGEASA